MLGLAGCKAVTLGEIHEFKDQILSSPGPITIDEINSAFKQALEQGVKNGALKLAEKGAFLNDPELRIPFPPEAQKLESKLRRIGLDSICDKFQSSVNSAAEASMQTAIPIFMTAIADLKFQDVVKLLKGNDTAITQFLKSKTEDELIRQFKPIVIEKLDAVSATKYWTQAVGAYNRMSSSADISADLGQFVTEQAVQGLFSQIAKEEKAIRKDPASRTTDLMRKVFAESDR